MPALRSSALLAGLSLSAALVAAPALAQQQGRNGWVDPPAKVVSPSEGAAKAGSAKSSSERPAAEAVRAPASKPAKTTAEAAQTTRRAERAAFRPSAHHVARAAREERRGPVRLAIRPAPQPAPAPTASDGRMLGWAIAAQDLTRDYFSTFSQPNGVSLGSTPHFYADRVEFHGRRMTLGAVLAEKRRFFARWPDRRYRARPDTIRTACNAGIATCQVDSTVDFTAINPDRGTRSQGTVAVRLGVSFAAGRPVIVSETSRVLSREQVASR
ncbi:hypothetical protein [Methylobacterium sp. ID0610]|uniref:hypothetical protein n=1 Tax=Methylobacterium carpenticola TaxID=3344827 RepID=UPI00367FBD5A